MDAVLDVNAIIERIKQLDQEIDRSAQNHNSLVGRSLELKELLQRMAAPAPEPEIIQEPAPQESGEVIEGEVIPSDEAQ